MRKIWKLKSTSPYASQLAHEIDIPQLKAQLLINRGILDGPSASSFLSPRLSNLTDPMLLIDMDSGLELILCAIEAGDMITIFGDYDADGLTATALLLNLFSDLGIPASSYIPNRLSEGYGVNREAISKIAKSGTRLLITVDCGTGNPKEIDLAIDLGMNVVVTDHHQVNKDFEPRCPVINPHRQDSSFPFKDLAGVGIAFFLAIAIRAALREQGWFKTRSEPDLKHYLDLVALGTVADVVPLFGLNRILVSAGIDRMRTSQWPGIRSIQKIAGIDANEITSDDLAFRIAPRLNAPGRLGKAEMGLHALTTDQPRIAMDIARQLDNLNSRRRAIEQRILNQIEKTILSSEAQINNRIFVIAESGWHKGVLGIVASRLSGKYHRPALILTIRDGMAFGSGRSIDGFNLHRALTRLGHLLDEFGGHHYAAGFRLKSSNLNALAMEMDNLARDELSEKDLIPTVEIDAEMPLSALTMKTLDHIKSLSPFGSGNPEPIFSSHSLDVLDSRVVGKKHLKLKVKQGRSVMEAIGFGLSDRHSLEGKTINAAFTPELNRWQGHKRLQLKIVDLEVKPY